MLMSHWVLVQVLALPRTSLTSDNLLQLRANSLGFKPQLLLKLFITIML